MKYTANYLCRSRLFTPYKLYEKCKKTVFEFGVKQFVPCSGLPYVKEYSKLISRSIDTIEKRSI